MALVYCVLSICSGAISIVLLWPVSPLLAVITAPLASSAVTFVIAISVAMNKRRYEDRGGKPLSSSVPSSFYGSRRDQSSGRPKQIFGRPKQDSAAHLTYRRVWMMGGSWGWLDKK